MTDSLKAALSTAADELGGVEPDIAAIARRGRRRRSARLVITVALAAAVVVAVALPLYGLANLGEEPRRPAAPSVSKGAEVTDVPTDGIVEVMTQQQEAEVFAFRAVAANGLMDPFGTRSYLFTTVEDTTRTDEGWRIGFAANDCAPSLREDGAEVRTCRGLSGHDERGNASTDTFVTVSLGDGRWTVASVEGNATPEDRERLIGYSLAQRREASHWEFPAVGMWPAQDGTEIMMVQLWVGPYPTTAPGSVCDVRAVDGAGEVVGAHRFYQEPPTEPFERAGGFVGPGLGSSSEPDRISVECRQYTGPGWELASEPRLLRAEGVVFGVEASLRWTGEQGFTQAAECDVSMVDANGTVVREGEARIEQLWRLDELADPPYEAEVTVVFRSQLVTRVEIGAFRCRSV